MAPILPRARRQTRKRRAGRNSIEKMTLMAMTNAEELFYTLLSDVLAREQFQSQFWDQLSQQVQDPEVRDIVSVRGYFAKQDAANIEKCFQLLGKQPTRPNVQAYQTMLEDWRREL